MSSGGLEITTVSLCKNMCTYCPQKLLQSVYGPKEYMTLETFQTCLSKIPKDIDILFAGFAEPFLNPECSTMIKIASQQGYLINLYTTLIGIREYDIGLLYGVKLNNVILHMPDNDGDMKCIVNQNYISNLKLFIKKIGFSSAHCHGPLHKKLNWLVDCNIQQKDKLHSRSNNNKEMNQNQRLYGKIVCDVIRRHNRANYNHNVLLPNGDVTLCCMDYGLKHKFGNLLTNSYNDLFESEAYKNLMNGLTNEDVDILCRTCSEARII
jgi:hypothetical protein